MDTVPCCYCGGPNPVERVTEAGLHHCMKRECVAAWRRKRIDESGLVPVLMHKQGLAWVRRDEVALNSMRRDGGR